MAAWPAAAAGVFGLRAHRAGVVEGVVPAWIGAVLTAFTVTATSAALLMA